MLVPMLAQCWSNTCFIDSFFFSPGVSNLTLWVADGSSGFFALKSDLTKNNCASEATFLRALGSKHKTVY